MHVELHIIFDDGEEKQFDMSVQDYRKLKQDIQTLRRPGSEATTVIGLSGGGEFILPWAKVKYSEALLRGEPDPNAVAKQLLSGEAG